MPGKKTTAKKTGRPTKFDAEKIKQAEKLCVLGATDEEVADFFEVDVRTLYRWRNSYPEFCQALKSGKSAADERVERSLYQKAIGFRQTAVKIFMPAGAEAPVYAPYVEHHAPDTTAAIFWLKNRRSQEWRDKQEHTHDAEGELAGLFKALLEQPRPFAAKPNGAHLNGHNSA